MANASASQVKQGAVIGGWICFALGVLAMYASVWTFLLYVPLFFVSFILSIIALAQKRIISGIVLLLCCIVVPIVLWLILSFTRAAKFMDEHPPPPLRQGSNEPAAPVPLSKPVTTGAGSISSSSTAVPKVNRAEMIAKVHGEDISSVDAHRLQIAFQTIVDRQASGQFRPSFSEDGKLLIYGRHEAQGISIVIANLDTLETVQVIRTEQEPRDVALSPDAVRLAYVTGDNHIRIKEIATGKEIELPVNAYGSQIRWPREGEILFGSMALNLDDLQYNPIDLTRYAYQGVRYQVIYGSPGLGSENWGFHLMNNDGSYGHLLFNHSLPAVGVVACWNVSLDQRHFCFLNAGLGVGPLTICYLGLHDPVEQQITVKRSEIQGLPRSVAEFLRRPPGQISETWPIFGGQINPLNHKIIGHNTSDFRGLAILKHETGEEWPVKVTYDKVPVREGDVLQLESTWWIWAPLHVAEGTADNFGANSQAVSHASSQSTSLVGAWRDESGLSTYQPDGTGIHTDNRGVIAKFHWRKEGDVLTEDFVELDGIEKRWTLKLKILKLDHDSFTIRLVKGKQSFHGTRAASGNSRGETTSSNLAASDSERGGFSRLIVGKWQGAKNMTLYFAKDGSYSVNPEPNSPALGTWQVDGDNLLLVFKDGRRMTRKIISITEDELDLERKGDVERCPRIRE